MAFRVELSDEASRDIAELYRETTARWSHRQAERWTRGLIATVMSLSDFPLRYPIAQVAHDLGTDIRAVVHSGGRHGVRIFYRVEGDAVQVVRVIHTARDLSTPDE